MNNKINQNNISNINFRGTPKAGEVKTMEKLIKEIVEDALCRAEREVAEYGSFTFSEKKFINPDENSVANKFWLGIEQAPKGVENYQTKRGLKFYAQKNLVIMVIII